MTPSDFQPPVIQFKKLDDLPPGRPNTSDEVMRAMTVLHKMLHAQSEAYGGKDSKLLAAGIAEAAPTFKTFLRLCEAQELSDTEKARRSDLYDRWKKLINMSPGAVEKFKKQQLEVARKNPKLYPGLKPAAAKSIGISSGVQSADWIIKMKRSPVALWTPEMWKWAGKQVSFVSRMSGNAGPLFDKDGNPTRKLLSLKIWGNDPT